MSAGPTRLTALSASLTLPPALPFTLGPLLFGRLHLLTLLQWLLLRVCETVECHSGFEFPFSPFSSLPLGAGAAAHLRHHEQPDANFASLLVCWDWLCATDADSRQKLRRKFSRDKGAEEQPQPQPHRRQAESPHRVPAAAPL